MEVMVHGQTTLYAQPHVDLELNKALENATAQLLQMAVKLVLVPAYDYKTVKYENAQVKYCSLCFLSRCFVTIAEDTLR